MIELLLPITDDLRAIIGSSFQPPAAGTPLRGWRVVVDVVDLAATGADPSPQEPPLRHPPWEGDHYNEGQLPPARTRETVEWIDLVLPPWEAIDDEQGRSRRAGMAPQHLSDEPGVDEITPGHLLVDCSA